jgi:hypothetical protein
MSSGGFCDMPSNTPLNLTPAISAHPTPFVPTSRCRLAARRSCRRCASAGIAALTSSGALPRRASTAEQGT